VKPIEIPGYEGQQISFEPPAGFKAAKLFVNGQPAQAAPKKGQYLLRRNDGKQETAFFKGAFPDPMPTLIVGEQTIKLAPPLSIPQWIWAGIPMILLMGGCIGGLMGAIAVTTNVSILRSDQKPLVKYVTTGLISLVAICFFVFLAMIIPRPQ
jgi:hypothetical protein